MKKQIALSLLCPALLCAMLLGTFFVGSADATLISDGTTVLRLDGGFLKRLRANGIRVAPAGGAVGRGRRLEIPLRGGQLMEAGIGVVGLGGGLRFESQSEKLAFKGMGLDTRHRQLSTSIGNEPLNLATVSRGASIREGFSIRLAARSLRLTGSLAALLNRTFDLRRVFRRGQDLGQVSVDASLRSVKAKGDTMVLVLDPAFAAKLAALGTTVSRFEEAQVDSSAITLPGLYGAIGSDLSSGTLWDSNGIRFLPKPRPGASELDVVQLSTDLASDVISARFRIDLPTTTETGPLATVDFSTAQIETSGARFTVPPRPALLSDFAARQLNTALLGDPNAAEFAAGEPFASVSLNVNPG